VHREGQDQQPAGRFPSPDHLRFGSGTLSRRDRKGAVCESFGHSPLEEGIRIVGVAYAHT
jgi:hypothetical protein